MREKQLSTSHLLNIPTSSQMYICYLQKMTCNFIARTKWSNIKSNYFVDAIIIFDLSYYTNITYIHESSDAVLCILFLSSKVLPA